MKLRIGTRQSRLAMIQTEIARDAILRQFPEAEIEIVPMTTRGDRMLDRSLTSFGGKGVFTKELEEALLKGRIDIAVHSAKDMPMEFPKGLELGAVLEREDAADVLVTGSGIPATELPPGSIIGTSSLRRQLQIRNINPQVRTKMLRGNVQTRLEKLKQGDYDGILLAAAGLKRLGLEHPEGLYLEYLDKETFVPAAGQGILALEIRQGELAEVMAAIHSPETAAELCAEREFLTILGGSCNAPCGAYCRREADQLVMSVMYARDGVHPVFRRCAVSLEAAGVPSQEARMELARELAGEAAIRVRFQPVCLVGAGPGDAGLLTKKGLECVRRADVIVYDNLVAGSILNEARLDAELIYAGKRQGQHHMPQEEISGLLVEQAMLGRLVVRLKGGDPYVFGRGGEEALELERHGIPYEIVPGVSSAYSVPAYAGIPVTHRGLASSFHVITGHEGAGKGAESIDYEVLAQEEGTLVFLMGFTRLGEIARRLMEAGKAQRTPAAVIQQGTTAGQQVVVSDLEHIAQEAARSGIGTPAIVVVGEVASLASRLAWFGRGPLSGKRVLVTGTRYMARELEEELEPLGAETIAISLIESRVLWTEKVRRALDELEDYQWLVFTSGNGVDLFFEVLREQGMDLRRLMHLKFAAIGRKTAQALEAHGFFCDFVPESFSGADLAREWIPTLTGGEKVLLLRAREGSDVLPVKLKEAGIAHADIALYETWVDTRRREELNRMIREVDYVTVASSSAARALSRMLEERENLAAKVISIGPFTTKTIRELGLPVYADAVEYTAEGIAAVILADVEETFAQEEPVQKQLAQETAQDGGSGGGSGPAQAAADFSNQEVPDRHFPIFLNLKGKKVLIVGAGVVASRRAAALVGFGADIYVVAPDGTKQMAELENGKRMHWERRQFVPADLDGTELVLAATDDMEVNDRIAALCREREIPVNHAGDQSQSDFYFPGLATEGPVVLGVTASGTDHHLARQLTEELREWLQKRN